jgi:hypothetical protein
MSRWHFVCVCLLLSLGRAHAQDDGARAYALSPVGVNQLAFQALFTRGNQSLGAGTVIEGFDIDVNVGVLQFTRTFSAGDRLGAFLVVIPVGEVEATVHGPSDVSTTSSGFGDATLGGILGLVGSPALTRQEFVSHQPGFALGLLARATLPTGEYDRNRAVNLGANRYVAQVGLPMSYAVGESLISGSLTTFELVPSLILFDENDTPYGAERLSQDPVWVLEAHATRNLNAKWWLSADALYRNGGETETDGVSGDDRKRSFALGVTLARTFASGGSLKITYGDSVSRNDTGVDGWMFRAVMAFVF